jgi:hypothetical protein
MPSPSRCPEAIVQDAELGVEQMGSDRRFTAGRAVPNGPARIRNVLLVLCRIGAAVWRLKDDSAHWFVPLLVGYGYGFEAGEITCGETSVLWGYVGYAL